MNLMDEVKEKLGMKKIFAKSLESKLDSPYTDGMPCDDV